MTNDYTYPPNYSKKNVSELFCDTEIWASNWTDQAAYDFWHNCLKYMWSICYLKSWDVYACRLYCYWLKSGIYVNVSSRKCVVCCMHYLLGLPAHYVVFPPSLEGQEGLEETDFQRINPVRDNTDFFYYCYTRLLWIDYKKKLVFYWS